MASKELTYQSTEGPFKVYDKRKPELKEPINTVEEFKKSILKAIEGYDKKQKKPVRWNFLKDNEGLFRLSLTLDPFFQYRDAARRIKGQESLYDTVDRKISERDYVDGFADISKGLELGRFKLGTSLSEILFAGTDLLLDTEFSTKVNKILTEAEPAKPETWRGDIAKLMAQFGVPAAISTKILHRATKAGPIFRAMTKMGTSKASKIAQRSLGGATVVGVTDFVASPDKREEGTFFDFAKPEPTENLTGRKKAAAIFRNKLRYGAEGTIVGGLFPIAGKGLQQTYKYAVKPVTKTTASLAFRGIGKGFQGAGWLLAKNPLFHSEIVSKLAGYTKNEIKKLISPLTRKFAGKGLPPRDQWRLFQTTSPRKVEKSLSRIDTVLSWFRSYGKMPRDIQGVAESVQLHITKQARKFDKLLEGVESRAYDLAKKFQARHNTNQTSKMLERQY